MNNASVVIKWKYEALEKVTYIKWLMHDKWVQKMKYMIYLFWCTNMPSILENIENEHILTECEWYKNWCGRMSSVKYLHLVSHQDGICGQVMEMYGNDACLLDSAPTKIHIYSQHIGIKQNKNHCQKMSGPAASYLQGVSCRIRPCSRLIYSILPD